MAGSFALKGQPLIACLKSFTNFAQSTLLALPSVSGEVFVWRGVTERFSVFGAVVIAVMLLGLWARRRDLFARVCGVWLLTAALLFVGVQWSVGESPLFSLYFSWAFIPLFCEGLRFIAGKFRRVGRAAVLALSCLTLLANAANAAHIIGFLA